MRNWQKLLITGLVWWVFVFYRPAQAQAGARLYFEPASGNYSIGEEFSVVVNVDPANSDTVAIDAIINYDTGRLELISVENNEYFGKEPAGGFEYVENETGKLLVFSFATVQYFSVNTVGKVATVKFKAKAEGTAAVTFVCSSGGDDDTSIWAPPPGYEELIDCAAVGSGSYTIGSGGESPTATPTPGDSGATATPTSSSLPDSGVIEPLVLTVAMGSLLVGLGFLGLIW